MKKVYLIITMLLLVTTISTEEIKHPNYEYLYRIENEKDVLHVLNTIKLWIAKYSNYNLSVKNAEKGAEELALLSIRKIPGPPDNNGDIIQCLFYLGEKRIDLLLSGNEMLGLTQSYRTHEHDIVYNRFYSLYQNNMKR